MDARVPPMTLTLTGEQYGGAYFRPAEFTLIATSEPDQVHLSVEDLPEPGHTLTLEQARTLRDQLAAQVRTLPQVGTLPAVEVATRWRWHSTDSVVELADDQLEELTSWLTYAIGDSTWDQDTDGDIWEF